MAIYDTYSLKYSDLITIDNNHPNINLALKEAVIPNFALLGKVYYMDGIIEKPIKGASIYIIGIPNYTKTIFSDDNGYYQIELPFGGSFWIVVSSPGFITSNHSVVTISFRIPIINNFELTKTFSYGNTIYGILSEEGAPNNLINNANLYISNINDTNTIVKATTSVFNGEYVICDLVDGSYIIRVYADGYNSKIIHTQPVSSATKLEENITLEPHILIISNP